MSNAAQPLPVEVIEALERGSPIEAIKLLRASTGLGLKEAKDVVDAHQRGDTMVKALSQALGPLPPAVVEALRSGNKVEAIKLMREHSGSGLKEAKDAVEASGQTERPTVTGSYAPGEVPRSSGRGWLVAVLAVVAAAVYFYFVRKVG